MKFGNLESEIWESGGGIAAICWGAQGACAGRNQAKTAITSMRGATAFTHFCTPWPGLVSRRLCDRAKISLREPYL